MNVIIIIDNDSLYYVILLSLQLQPYGLNNASWRQDFIVESNLFIEGIYLVFVKMWTRKSKFVLAATVTTLTVVTIIAVIVVVTIASSAVKRQEDN